MSNYSRKKRRPVWMAVPLWGFVGGVTIWGGLQFRAFREKLLAETPARSTKPAPAAAAAAPAPDDAATLVLDDRAPRDPWADATTPVAARLGRPEVNETPAPPPAAPETRTPEQWLDLGRSLLDQSHIPEGRTALNAALAVMPADDSRAAALRDQLSTLNAPVFLSSAVVPEDPAAPFVEIRPGDSFLKLGRQYDVPATLLQKMNPTLNPRDLKPGDGIKVVQGPFNLRYAKSAKRIDLYVRDLYVTSLPATVQEGDYVPRGVYRLKAASKIEVNGKRWIGFEGAVAETREITIGWIYGSAGPRLGRNKGMQTGLKMNDADLQTLYNVLVESKSLLKVDP